MSPPLTILLTVTVIGTRVCEQISRRQAIYRFLHDVRGQDNPNRIEEMHKLIDIAQVRAVAFYNVSTRLGSLVSSVLFQTAATAQTSVPYAILR